MADSQFDNFYEWLRFRGLEFFDKYYGLYEANVTNNADPEKRGRVQVLVPNLDESQPLDHWFLPSMMQVGAQHGWFWPPEVGDRVLVTFRMGSANEPAFYFGGWQADGEMPALLGYTADEETPPVRRGFVTATGHAFVVNEEKDKEEIDLIWTKGDKTSSLKLLPNGSVQITNQNQSQVFLDAENKKIVVEDKDNSNVITLDSNGVKIETKGKVEVAGATDCIIDASAIKLGGSGAGKSAVLGEDLIQWLNQHTHPTGVGPSGPPVAPATAALTSTVVKLK